MYSSRKNDSTPENSESNQDKNLSNNSNTLGSESKTSSNQNPKQLGLFQEPDAHEIEDGEPQRRLKAVPGLTTVPEKTEPTVTKPVSTKAVRQQPKKTNKQRSSRSQTPRPKFPKFDIHDYFDRLEPAKEKGKYLCPVCGGHNFSISKDGVKWNCHNDPSKEHRSAINNYFCEIHKQEHSDPYSNNTESYSKKIIKKNMSKPVTALIDTNLDTIELIKTDLPVHPMGKIIERKGTFKDKEYDQVQTTNYSYGINRHKRIDYYYQGVRVAKNFIWEHWDNDEENWVFEGNKSDTILPWRYDAIPTEPTTQWLIACEGQKAVEQYIELGLLAIDSYPNHLSKEVLTELKTKIGGLVIHPDNDDTGHNKATDIQKNCLDVGLPCLVIEPLKLWENLPNKGDIVELVSHWREENMSNQDIQEKILKTLREQMRELLITVPSLNKETSELKRYPVLSLSELLNSHHIKRDWLIPNFLPVGETVLLTAAPKIGKTLLSTDLVWSILTRRTAPQAPTFRYGDKVLAIYCQ